MSLDAVVWGWQVPIETAEVIASKTGAGVTISVCEVEPVLRTESKYIQLIIRRWPMCFALGVLSYKQG